MPQPSPRVSIIIRTDGRRPAYLAEAIATVGAQTYADIELILVEDGCAGVTRSALGSTAYPREIRTIPIQKSGRSIAGNTGLAAAHGELIGFLDDDDLLLPRHVEALVRAHQGADFGAAYAWAWEAPTYELGKGQAPVQEKRRVLIKPGPLTPSSLLARNRIPIQAVLFRRRLYEQCGGFDESLDHLEDWDLWLRYVAAARFEEVREATSIYRVPAEKEALQDRAKAHRPALDKARRRLLARAELSPRRSAGTQTPAVSVVIVNYNAGHHLTRCLTALQRQTIENFEAFVIDNASTDESFDRALQVVRDDRMRYFKLPVNTGFAMANNLGATLARAPWLATLNPDAFAESTWLAALLDGAQRHPNAGMFGSTQIDDQDPTRLDGAGDRYLFCGVPWRGGSGQPIQRIPAESETFGPCAAAALYKMEGFRALGGFDERYFCYVEDVDLAYRWRLAGGWTIQIPMAVVRHVGGASSQGNQSPIARYYGTRNLVWTFLKNTPSSLLWFALPAHLGALLVLVAKSLVKGGSRTILRALIDALRGMPSILETRKDVQTKRTAPLRALSAALTWNIGSYLRRDPNP
ncbi:MAG: glycosyltransferase family 2 protein [Alphaproteobacteria bacterium]